VGEYWRSHCIAGIDARFQYSILCCLFSEWTSMNVLSTAKFIVNHPLNRTGRLSALGRFLRWQFASRLIPYPIAIPFVDEYRLFVERGMTGATGNYYCGLHEADDMAFVLHFLRPGDVFYDIGANIGSYTILAAAADVAMVQSFEPSAATCERLRRNVILNGLGDKVVVQRCALGEREGEIRFTRTFDTTNHVATSDDGTAATETVPIRRLDDVYLRGRPSFLKIDVEGYESHVLSGAASALDDPGLMGMLIEENGSNNRYKIRSMINEMLTSRGFKSFRYDPLRRDLTATKPGAGSFGNILFLRDPALATERVRGARKFRLINGWL
jgi:FkbM family methyltransferase